MKLTMEEIFDNVLETVCSNHSLEWWEVVDGELWEKEVIPFIANAIGVPVMILETMSEFIDWSEEMFMNI